MEFDSLNEIVTDLPIFGSFSQDVSNIGNLRRILSALFYTKKIELKCTECKMNYPFSVQYSIVKNGINGEYKYGAGWSFNNLDNEVFFENDIVFPKKDEGVIEYTFKCSMNHAHFQKLFLLYELNSGTIVFRKIGQKPLNTDLKDHLSNVYKKILNKYQAFEDFRCFEQSESRGLLAGGCTYLRRIFEKMVNKMMFDPNISDEQRNEAKHFEDKIKLVKKQFDDDIQEILNNSYSLLSKGIHELDNQEIKQFYGLMAEVICVQLESEMEKDEKNTRRKELKKSVSSAIQHFDKE